jgi:hypothetical protein
MCPSPKFKVVVSTTLDADIAATNVAIRFQFVPVTKIKASGKKTSMTFVGHFSGIAAATTWANNELLPVLGATLISVEHA